MNENNQPPPLSDAELQGEITILVKKATTILAQALIFTCVSIILGITAKFIAAEYSESGFILAWISLAAFMTACVLLILYIGANRKIKAFVSANITQGILTEVFEIEEYESNACINEDTIRNMGLVGGWNRCSGNDYVRGKYKGHKIIFSDVKLEHASQSTDSDGDTHEDRDTIFQGTWIILEHDKELPASLRLREKVFFTSKNQSDIETENASFNAQFQILTTDGQTAFLILTPHFMEFITSADVKANGNTFMIFDRHRICIAVHNGKDLFEPGSKELKDIVRLRESQRADIKYLTDILDELMNNDYLFKKQD